MPFIHTNDVLITKPLSNDTHCDYVFLMNPYKDRSSYSLLHKRGLKQMLHQKNIKD